MMLRSKNNWAFLFRVLPFHEDIVYNIIRLLPKWYFYRKVKQIVKFKEHRKDKYYVKHKIR